MAQSNSAAVHIEFVLVQSQFFGHSQGLSALRLIDLEARDRIDSTRAVSPLRPADDAIVIDTTDLSVEQVVADLAARV